MQVNEKIFREYDIRGNADVDLANPTVLLLGKALGTYLQQVTGAKKISLGYDVRLSSDRIQAALAQGLLSTGIDVVNVGMVPTPLLYFSIPHLKTDGGVMITGSHNPPEYNGFKISTATSTLHGKDIQDVKNLVLSQDFQTGNGQEEKACVRQAYIDYIVGNIRHPMDVSVVIDCGNATGGLVAPELYERLGCKVTTLFAEPDGNFPNHHPDPTVLKNLVDLQAKVKDVGAMLGIGFDGDSDRIGVVDKTGKVIYGDELLILYARDILKNHPGAKVISEVKASNRLFNDVNAHGGDAIMWKTGHSLIKAKMKETGAKIAGEMSGHMFFADRYFGYDDAIYAGARLLEIVSESKRSPSELLSDVPESFTTPEIRMDCSDSVKFDVVAKTRAALEEKGLKVIALDGARVEFDDGWGLIRASNTQPVLVYRFEATTKKRLEEIRKLVEDTVAQFLPASG